MGMAKRIRDGVGVALVVVALAVLFGAVTELRARDYLASTILVLTGLAVMRAGVELLRPVGDG